MSAKKSKNAPQASLFRRDVPKMPEGYYTPGPNPNLRRFVEEHATPYDPTTDDYNEPPFDQPITTTKMTAIYNMHSYHQGKKPHDAIQQYIRHYTNPGGIVFDMFSGSGSTALASLIENRAAIAIDLSPAATFITRSYCTPIDLEKLTRNFELLLTKIEPEFEWLYGTCCDLCDGKAITTFTVISSVFQCPRCLTKLPLFDCTEVEAQTIAGKNKKIRVCPHCLLRGQQEEIKTSSQHFKPIPVLVGYECLDGCRGEHVRHHNDSNLKKKEYFEKFDLAKIIEIDEKTIPHKLPTQRMMNIESDTAAWGDKWRAGTSNFRTVIDLFTKRNLWALASIYEYINALDSADSFPLLLGINAILLAMSRMQGYIDDPRFPNQLLRGTYYLPQISREYNVSKWFKGKIRNLAAGYKHINASIASPNILISTQSATNFDEIPNQSIDYIFTDPPYSDIVQYGELNFVWEAWLGLDTNWHDKEIIVNQTRGKTDSLWAEMMLRSMSECFRVLKPGRWISLCYHDTSEGTWQLLQDLMSEAGFISEKSSTTLFIDAGQKSYNQLTAEKVTQRDLVINFRKPREGELAAKLLLSGEEDPTSFKEKAQFILREALERLPGAPADRLYDELVSRMVRKGEFQRHNFDALLRTVAEETGGRWYLIETADQMDETEGQKENTAAARLDIFMGKYMQAHPGEGSVHYSNLFEEYLPVSDKPRRLLQDWLPEYFYKTDEGTWRLPLNDDERQIKTNLRLSGELRHIKRFANALSAGVPPAERDRPSNAATLAEWIYQCRRSGLYDLGRVLYERGGLRFDSLGEDSQMQVEEDYQICVKRDSANEKKPARKKKETVQYSLDLE